MWKTGKSGGLITRFRWIFGYSFTMDYNSLDKENLMSIKVPLKDLNFSFEHKTRRQKRENRFEIYDSFDNINMC